MSAAVGMSAATAVQPNWQFVSRPRIEDSRRYWPYDIDISEAAGRYRLSRFRRLVTQWRVETYFSSSAMDKTNHHAFKEIVSMGESAVPLIVDELRMHRDFLFMALHLILKEDPTPTSAKGAPHKLIDAWLEWAEVNID